MNNRSSLPPHYGLTNQLNLLRTPLQSQPNYDPNLIKNYQLWLQIQYQQRLHLLQLYEMENQLKFQSSQSMHTNRMQSHFGNHNDLSMNVLDTYKKTPYPYFTFNEELVVGKQSPHQSDYLSTNSISPYQQPHNDFLNEILPHYQNISFAAKTIQSDMCKLEDKEICCKPQLNQKPYLNQQTGHIKTQISNMVEYFTTRFGKDKPEETSRHRMFYGSNEQMLRIFDAIAKRYTSTGKCREDMSRFAMRKALTFLRDQERKVSDSNVHDASLAMCRKYFSLDPDAHEQDILNELLPYKKNSKNKTPNCDFAAKIFSSEAFCADYKQYLSQFDQLMEADNKKKVKKFVEFLVGCAENDSIDKIDTYKRMPWLSGWIESTKIVANELLAKNSINGPQHMMTQGEGDKKKKRGRVPH